MFQRIDATDFSKFSRGFIALLIIVVAGVTIAEIQLNTLTHRQDSVRAFAVKREDNGQYRGYLLGSGVGVRAVYPLATLTADNQMIIHLAGRNFTVSSTVVEAYRQDILLMTGDWYRQFLKEALEGKQAVQEYLAGLGRAGVNYLKQFR